VLEDSRRGRLTSVLPLVGAVGIGSAAALLAASLAFAQPPAQSGASAAQQYVEDVPTANGQSTTGATKPAVQPLSPVARSALRRLPRATAGALATIATSPAYGAPTIGASTGGAIRGSSQGGALASTADAIGAASDGRLLGLLVVLVMTSIGAAGLAVRRGRT
jgi:hypothetical protein